VLGVAVNGTSFYRPSVPLTTSWQPFTFDFTSAATTTSAALTFNFAADTGSVWIDGVTLSQGNATPPPTPVPTPPDSIMLGVTNHPAPWDMAALTQFEQDSGKGVAILNYFINYEPNNPPERHRLAAVQALGKVPMITWQWNQTNLAGILSGQYDADARLWAWELKAHGGPVLLRWGHEMNGPWFAWGLGTNGNTAPQFVSAWRRLHGIFQQEGATNVQWVWCPNIIEGNSPDFRPMYPGDAYVDWVALDGYNWATLYSWRTFTQVFQYSYTCITALTQKPLMIAEWGSTEQGGDKGAWLRSALTTEIPASFPRIKAVVYFNQNYEEDWRITSSENARRGYADGIASPIYRSTWP
jgi:hypothetical protein